MLKEWRETAWWNVLLLVLLTGLSMYVILTHQPAWFIWLVGVATGMRVVTTMVYLGPSHEVD